MKVSVSPIAARSITTMEELKALPAGTILEDADGDFHLAVLFGNVGKVMWVWFNQGHLAVGKSAPQLADDLAGRYISLPGRVLHAGSVFSITVEGDSK